MQTKALVTAFILLVQLWLISCGSQPHKVERIAVDEVNDLSGRWNDTDSRLVSEEMVRDMLNRAWLNKHVQSTGNMPTVIVGSIHNLSHEHINVLTFINDIEREIINSGEVNFVADAKERLQIREERRDQDLNASAATRKAMGQELGADYILVGSINTIVDQLGKTRVVYYQTDLKLLSLTDNRTAWIGQKKIKKLIEGHLHY